MATRVLKPLSAFPSYLTMLAITALRGGRVQLVEGPPGSAKTALVAMAYVFLSTFTDIDTICTSQQNSTSFEISDAVLKVADSDSESALGMHVLVSGQALTDAQKQLHYVLRPDDPNKVDSLVSGRLAICTLGMALMWRKGVYNNLIEKRWDLQIIDEAQGGASGDQQLLASRVKRDGGITFLNGDRNQERNGPLSCMGHLHVHALERAFMGGLLLDQLGDPVNMLRASVPAAVTAIMEERRGNGNDGIGLGGRSAGCGWRSVAQIVTRLVACLAVRAAEGLPRRYCCRAPAPPGPLVSRCIPREQLTRDARSSPRTSAR